MQWRGADVDPDGTYPEQESWTPVEIPGRPTQFAGAEAVAYRTTLDDPLSGSAEHAVLELQGCYGDTTVWCNGTEVASHDHYFAPLRVRLDEHLTEETDLRVVCRRPTDGIGGIYETDTIPPGEAVPGIWWDATLRTYPGTYIDELHAQPKLDGDQGTIDVTATVVADEAIDDRLTLSVRPAGNRRERGMMERAAVQAEAGERVTVEHTVDLRDPALWWPAELGPQNRYAVTAKFDGMERTRTTGFCDVAYDGERVTVNGTETTLRGVNLLDATPADVRRASEVNANFVRTHAHAPSPDVVDACETEGMLLWVDLPLTGSRAASVDVEQGQAIATALGRSYGHAAALAAIGVHDDPVDPFASPLGSGVLDRLRFRWRTWRAGYDGSTARTIAEALPASVATFPVVGQPGIDADASAIYPGWKYGDVVDLKWVLDRAPEDDVVAEFGAGSLATESPSNLAGHDKRTHAAHTDGDLAASQQYQASVVKQVAEGLRNAGTSIVAAYALRDTGDAGMGVLGAEGDRKSAHDALATAFEPVQATLADPTAEESDVLVHNDLDRRFTGELSWESPASSGVTDVTIGTNAHATVATVEVPEEGTLTLRLSTGDRTVENKYRG